MNSISGERFSWNPGGLAGTAVGASAWMPVAALASGWPAIGTAAAFMAAGFILVCAYLLWRVRHKLSAFTGLLVLLSAGFVAALLFFAVALGLDLPLVSSWPDGHSRSPRHYAWILLLYPALAAWFCWLNYRRHRTWR